MAIQQQFTQQQKLAVVKSAREVGMKEAARLAGVHFTTVYEWRRRVEAMGEEAFVAYEPPAPGRGVKEIDPEKEQAVLAVCQRHPALGPGQVRNQLRRQRITMSTRSVRAIMEAHGLRLSRKKPARKQCRRFEASRPLELVQMDILEFYINKAKVYLFVLLDDFSRFILGFRLVPKTSVDEVIGLVQEAIGRYGKMEEILTDRGFVFYSWHGANRFERYLELERIDHTHARAHHPQTLGKIEACNRQLQGELLRREHFSSIHEAERGIARWVEHYNYERTHQGLGGLLVPADRFHGRTAQVLYSLGEGIDAACQSCYAAARVERSIVNLVLAPEGRLMLYLLGQPLVLAGGADGREAYPRGGGHTDPGAQDPQGQGSGQRHRCEEDLRASRDLQENRL
jgi:transposase InsO family protein